MSNNILKNKRILITGAAGSIGSELVRQLVINNEIYCIDINETGVFDLIEELKLKKHKIHGRIGDVRDFDVVSESFIEFAPDIVFHAAALKHVTPNEWKPLEAIKTNILGTYNVLECAKDFDVQKFVYISTDKVIHANSIMGATKKVGEIMVKNAGYTVVRFGNVLGSRGSVIPIWQQQIDNKEPITITHPDMERYFMTIPQACELVIKAAEQSGGGEIWIMDMGKPIKILELAKKIIEQTGKEIQIKEIGIRSGETLTEELMTEEEKQVAVKRGNFWIV